MVLTQMDPETLLLRRERMQAVARVLAVLAPSQRAVLELAHSQGLAVPAMAAPLGCSVSTVKPGEEGITRHVCEAVAAV